MAPRKRKRSRKKAFEALIEPVGDQVVLALRKAAVEVMNNLAEQGPAYNGDFSSAWYAVPSGQEPKGPRSSGTVYRYDLRNVPKTKFETIKQGKGYEVVNGSDYAPQALDLEEGRFISQIDENGDLIQPVKSPVVEGTRFGAKRGQVSSGTESEVPSISTAPQDWYTTYAAGGGLKISFERGVKLGFRSGPGAQRGFG